MVKSIINVRRSSICWRGRRELITDVRKPEIMVAPNDVIVGGELFTDYSDHPRKLVTKPQSSNQQAWTLQLLSLVEVRCLPQAAWPERLLRKVRTLWHCSRLGSVALYLWLIVVISVRQSTVTAISADCRALIALVSSSIRLTAWLQKFKEAGGTVREIDTTTSENTAIISALVICIIVCLSWAVNHYRDNAITYKAQRDKNARELKLGEHGNYWHADASAWCCCARCKIHEELADAKAENDALHDDVAAGRRQCA